MQRAIKFRGLGLSGAWAYGLLSISQGYEGQPEPGYYISNSAGMPWAYKVLPESVGQWTGELSSWKDEMYEGNRVKILYGDWPSKPKDDPRSLDQYLEDIAIEGTICFYDGAFCVRFSSGVYGSIHPGAGGFIKVIGSIHTHPEPLKEKV